MNYTPFDFLTNDELLRHVATRKDPSDLELELAHRLESLMLEVDMQKELADRGYERMKAKVTA